MPWIAGLIIAGVVLFAVKAAAQHAALEPRLPVPKFRNGQSVLVTQSFPGGAPSLIAPGVIAATRFDGPAGTVTYDVDLVSGLSIPAVPETSLSPAPPPAKS